MVRISTIRMRYVVLVKNVLNIVSKVEGKPKEKHKKEKIQEIK